MVSYSLNNSKEENGTFFRIKLSFLSNALLEMLSGKIL